MELPCGERSPDPPVAVSERVDFDESKMKDRGGEYRGQVDRVISLNTE